MPIKIIESGGHGMLIDKLNAIAMINFPSRDKHYMKLVTIKCFENDYATYEYNTARDVMVKGNYFEDEESALKDMQKRYMELL